MDEEYLTTRLPRLLDVVQRSDVSVLELQEDGVKLRLHRTFTPGPPMAEEILPSEPERLAVRAPLVGTFYRAGQPGMAPLVSEGSHVQNDTVVGIIEALQVLTEVQAGCRGVVTKVFATDGQPVEYGQSLLEVEPGG